MHRTSFFMVAASQRQEDTSCFPFAPRKSRSVAAKVRVGLDARCLSALQKSQPWRSTLLLSRVTAVTLAPHQPVLVVDDVVPALLLQLFELTEANCMNAINRAGFD